MIMETLIQRPNTYQNIITPAQETLTVSDLNPENISLHELVDQLMSKLLPEAVNRKSLIINNIEQHLLVNTDRATLAQVLESLMDELIRNSEGGCVRVEAATAGNMTLIHVKDCGASFNNNIACSLQKVRHLAKKLGGSLCISSNPSVGMVVAFTLYSQLQAA